MRDRLRLRGSLTALITPFRNGCVDEPALAGLIERQIKAGTSGLVACGTTGEAPALTVEEYERVIATVVEVSSSRVPVIAGCGAGNTEQACRLAGIAEDLGASALLCSAPPYVKPTQMGLHAHTAAVAQSAELPIVLYDIPGRCAVGFSDETILRLAESGQVVALKDASGDLTRPLRLRAALGGSFSQLSGDDATVSAYLAMGGDGCISVTANVAPGLCARLHAAWDAADHETFRHLTGILAPLHRALFLESNPIPVKAALELLGLIVGDVRLPLTAAEPATIRELDRCLERLQPNEAPRPTVRVSKLLRLVES